MNENLKEDARELAERLKIPLDEAEAMVNWRARHKNDTDLPSITPAVKPVPKKLLQSWIPGIIACFQHFMPAIDKPYPKIFFSTASTFRKTRKQLLEMADSQITEFPEDSLMEYIHGSKGGVILIRRELLGEFAHSGEKMLYYYFSHFLWHELGHFYAINSETTDLHCYNSPGLADDSQYLDPLSGVCTLSSERKKQEGYWMWEEFIAECIANYVSYKHRSSSLDYHPERMVWEPQNWGAIPDRLEMSLDEAFNRYQAIVDGYSLGHYFAYLLTDDLCKMYVEAAEAGKLKVYDQKTGVSILPAEPIEPTCISDQMEGYQPDLWRLHGILSKQLAKERFWMIDEETLEEIGDCIANLTVAKNRMLSELMSI